MPRVEIPRGRYEGEHPEDVPLDYLLYISREWDLDSLDPELVEEIEAQIALKQGYGVSR